MRTENVTFSQDREYLKPASMQEALGMYGQYGHEAVILAGATDAFVRKTLLRRVVIDIMGTGLDYVKEEGGALHIGACATCKQVADALCGGPFSIVGEGAHSLGSPQIRNMATIGGNLCNAAPSADCAPALYVLGAEVVLTGPSGSRTLPIGEFITGPGKTGLAQGELLMEIIVPAPAKGVKTCFEKVVRTRGLDLALVNGAIALETDGGKALKSLKVCLGAVAPTPLLLEKEFAKFKGKELADAAIDEIAEIAAAAVKPITDVRSSKEYRTLRCKTLVSRGLKGLLAGAAKRQ